MINPAKPESDCWSDDSDSDKKSVSFSNTIASTYATSDDSVSTSGHEIEADCLHHLYCQYNETSSPHDRVPLTLKINELAQIYPGLMEFQSLELSPCSWMAVAWYPIYQIPVTRNVKELSAYFITYHTLSSFQAYDANLLATVSDAHNMGGLPGLLCPCRMQGLHSTISENNDKFQCIDTLGKDHGSKTLERDESKGEMALPPFAAATYKMHGELWTTPETSDKEKIGFYLNAANSWLKHRKFRHHDFISSYLVGN
ncbi:uncharacterized protein LOC112197364 isoform X2 [Rosa chinensis]|uniref:uncharacterized protein LOC112197364 isoform X2 n=1 Tax=Rosa chinensis TaxID=74649 RepID=UPI001AD8DBBB|nr:uncharacterized protein LOC112197364 isoform X2 [Rosa chinensis]